LRVKAKYKKAHLPVTGQISNDTCGSCIYEMTNWVPLMTAPSHQLIFGSDTVDVHNDPIINKRISSKPEKKYHNKKKMMKLRFLSIK
jgi:hypothetical protein